MVDRVPQHPMQPIYFAKDDVIRFKSNAIVRRLIDEKIISLNDIVPWVMTGEVPVEDAEQFWQLLGYSVSGYGDLSFVRPEIISAADGKADEILRALEEEGRR